MANTVTVSTKYNRCVICKGTGQLVVGTYHVQLCYACMGQGHVPVIGVAEPMKMDVTIEVQPTGIKEAILLGRIAQLEARVAELEAGKG